MRFAKTTFKPDSNTDTYKDKKDTVNSKYR